MVPPEKEDRRPQKAPEDLSIVGGDDPDFILPTGGRPLVCAIPVLRGMLPQCRSADPAEVNHSGRDRAREPASGLMKRAGSNPGTAA